MASQIPHGAALARALANKNLRYKLPDSALTPALLAKRQAIQTARAPVTPGSSMTNADLARAAKAAVQTQYGPTEQALASQVASGQQLGRDTASWYDQYKDELAQHQANTAAVNQAAADNLTSLTAQAGKVDTSGQNGSAAGDAVNAAAIRTALTAGFGALANQTGANANTYADTLTHVVAPGQKLSALNQAAKAILALQDKQTALKTDEGAYATKFKGDTVANEAKDVLTQQALTGKTAAQQEANRLTSERITESGKTARARLRAEENSPTAQKTKADLEFFKQHGYYPPTGPPSSSKTKSPWAPQAAQGKTADSIGSALTPAKRLKAAGYSRAQAAQVLLSGADEQGGKPMYDKNGKRVINKDGTQATTPATGSIPKADSQLIASVALDIAYDGHISARNIKLLHARGIRVNSLGYPTKAPSAGTQVIDTINTVRRILPRG